MFLLYRKDYFHQTVNDSGKLCHCFHCVSLRFTGMVSDQTGYTISGQISNAFWPHLGSPHLWRWQMLCGPKYQNTLDIGPIWDEPWPEPRQPHSPSQWCRSGSNADQRELQRVGHIYPEKLILYMYRVTLNGGDHFNSLWILIHSFLASETYWHQFNDVMLKKLESV